MDSTKNHQITINCKDIILREYRMEDLDKLHEITWQPEVFEYLPGWNVSKEMRADWLIHYEIPENNQFLQAVNEEEHVNQLRLRLAIVLKDSGEFIGWCCSGIKDELPEPNREIMYGISKEHRNKGYTTQAVKGMIDYLFENTKIEELSAIALLNNIPSNKVIGKCGFEYKKVIEIDNEEYNYYKIYK